MPSDAAARRPREPESRAPIATLSLTPPSHRVTEEEFDYNILAATTSRERRDSTDGAPKSARKRRASEGATPKSAKKTTPKQAKPKAKKKKKAGESSDDDGGDQDDEDYKGA